MRSDQCNIEKEFKIKKIKNLVLGLMILTFALTNIEAYIGPNYATSTESSPIGLYYDGYLQVARHYPYGLNQKYQDGWIQYYEGNIGVNDTGKLFTDTISGSYRTKKYRYWDNLNPWAPPTQFRYGFTFYSVN